MCKSDKDCMRGQTCTSGVCTGTAEDEVDELADTEPQRKVEPPKEEVLCEP